MPAPTEQPAQQHGPQTQPTTSPQLTTGDTYTDTATSARYKITSTESGAETVTYLGTTNEKAENITIPESIIIGDRVYKVTVVVDNVFKNNKTLKGVGSKAFKCLP